MEFSRFYSVLYWHKVDKGFLLQVGTKHNTFASIFFKTSVRNCIHKKAFQVNFVVNNKCMQSVYIFNATIAWKNIVLEETSQPKMNDKSNIKIQLKFVDALPKTNYQIEFKRLNR